MKRRMHVSICLSVLLTLVLTACAGAAEVKLTPSDGAVYDGFGYSAAISGDYAIIGALGGGDSYNSGAAYIFKRNGTGWDQQAKITASDGTTGDRSGYYSVSISGDYAIVGAWGDDDNGNESGSAYIYKCNGTTWSEQVKITASDGTEHDGFGWSVFVSGDYAIVSAIGGGGFGSAYIYKRDGTTWSQQAKIMASDGAVEDGFGWSASISGDYAIVGAPYDDDNGVGSGSAYIYDIQTTEPQITGDLNGDDLLTPADAVIALKMAAGCREPTTAADVSSDGVVNSLDALMILQAAADLITL